MTPMLFRVIVSVSDIDEAAYFYGMVFGSPGRRITPGRHYFDAGGTTIGCYDAEADGDETPHMASPEPIYFAVADVDALFERFNRQGLVSEHVRIKRQPTGERSFYMQDPFGNPLAFVDRATCADVALEVAEKQQDLSVS